jgi:hypothetical protein
VARRLRRFWETSYQQLDFLLDELKKKQTKKKNRSRKKTNREITNEPNGTMQLATPSDKEIVVTRIFDAPRQFVFDAHTKSELLKRWLTGAPG